MSDADGVALTSTAHPVAPWYRRLWLWLRRPRISPESLETIEISTYNPWDWNGIADYAERRRRRGLLNGVFVDDKEIEQEIQAKGLTAPRVTLMQIESCIAWEYYASGAEFAAWTTPVLGPAYKAIESADITPLSCLTLCVLHLKNGFIVTGENACASPGNFDEAIGRKLARQKAVDKIWALEDYRLKDELYEESKPGLTRAQLDANATAKSDDPLGRPKTV